MATTKKATEATVEEKTTKKAPAKKATATKTAVKKEAAPKAEEVKAVKAPAKKAATKTAAKKEEPAKVEEAKPAKAPAKKAAAKKVSKATKAPTTYSCDCIVRPVLTEESMSNMQNLNKITVEVKKSANKVEIKNAFESIFGVKVSKVNTSFVRAKYKRVGKYSGTTSSYKKAIVTLAEGQSLDLLKSKE